MQDTSHARPRRISVQSLFERWFAVHHVDPRRAVAFGLLYFAIFSALTLLDGVAVSMFVKRVGAESLPQYFGVIAVANLLAVGLYVSFAERFSSLRVFVGLAAGLSLSCLGAWWCLTDETAGTAFYGSLYAAREVFQALFLLHFGTFLQRFFTRKQLQQVMPLVYAGGRVGGMAGGAVLTHAGASVGLVNLLLVAAVVALWVAGGAVALSLRFRPADDARDEEASSALDARARDLDRRARESARGFFDALRRSPLLLWHSLSGVAYIGCRYVLAFQYSTFFEGHFADEVELAAFLGVYAQVALGASLVLQLFLVNRLVRWVGLRGTQFGYATCVVAALGLSAVHPTLAVAVFGRFVEQELRLGLRNPTNQLVLNFLSRPLRVRMRCWNAGVVTPVATMATSLSLGFATATAWPLAVPALGLGVGFAYFVSNRFMNLSYAEKTTLGRLLDLTARRDEVLERARNAVAPAPAMPRTATLRLRST